jgi:EF hand
LQPFFVERVFQIFDKDDSGSISFQEFLDAMHQFAGQTPDDKIKFLFKVYDIDGKLVTPCCDPEGLKFFFIVMKRQRELTRTEVNLEV